MKALLVTGVLLAINFYCQAQSADLVQNGSFEEYEECPFSINSSINTVDHWTQARGSVDYLNSCANYNFDRFGVPQNFVGDQLARTGSAYANFAAYSNDITLREYLLTELTTALAPEVEYRLEFYVSRADSSNFAISNVGGYFSVQSTSGLWPSSAFFVFDPQVESEPSVPIVDSSAWVKVSGTFVAEGGERYLTIGNFRSDEDIDTVLRVSNHLPLQRWDASSYYIDDVSLIPVDSLVSVQEVGVRLDNSVSLYPNPTKGDLTVQFTSELDGEYVLSITGLDGREMKSIGLFSVSSSVYMGDLAKGVYFATVSDQWGMRIFNGKVVLID